MRVAATLLALALLVLAPASGGTASGVTGIVLRGPTQPVCRVGESCEGPAQVTLVFSHAGRETARVRSGTNGRFRLALPPASYVVRTTERVFGRQTTPARVTVRRGSYVRVTFRIDTGIR